MAKLTKHVNLVDVAVLISSSAFVGATKTTPEQLFILWKPSNSAFQIPTAWVGIFNCNLSESSRPDGFRITEGAMGRGGGQRWRPAELERVP